MEFIILFLAMFERFQEDFHVEKNQFFFVPNMNIIIIFHDLGTCGFDYAHYMYIVNQIRVRYLMNH